MKYIILGNVMATHISGVENLLLLQSSDHRGVNSTDKPTTISIIRIEIMKWWESLTIEKDQVLWQIRSTLLGAHPASKRSVWNKMRVTGTTGGSWTNLRQNVCSHLPVWMPQSVGFGLRQPLCPGWHSNRSEWDGETIFPLWTRETPNKGFMLNTTRLKSNKWLIAKQLLGIKSYAGGFTILMHSHTHSSNSHLPSSTSGLTLGCFCSASVSNTRWLSRNQVTLLSLPWRTLKTFSAPQDFFPTQIDYWYYNSFWSPGRSCVITLTETLVETDEHFFFFFNRCTINTSAPSWLKTHR